MPFISQRTQDGFTLLELLVVIAIMTIMTLVILINFPDFRTQTELDLIGQEMAITWRQAQSYGVTARGSSGEGLLSEAEDAYGISLDTGSPNSFFFFNDNVISGTDEANNHKYDSNPGCGQSQTECVEHFLFRGGIKIIEIVANDDIDKEDATIIFHRPDVEPIFYDASGVIMDGVNKLSIIIGKEPVSELKNQRKVEIWSTGHIYSGRIAP